MRRILVIGAFAVLAAAILVTVRIVSNPLRQSDSDLRAWLLGKTPLGSASNEVRAFVLSQGWYTDRLSTTQPSSAKAPFIAGELGSYQGFPWHTSVRAFWEFTDNRLADIRIERIIDSP